MKCFLIVVIFCLATGSCNSTSIRRKNQIKKEPYSDTHSIEREGNVNELKDKQQKKKPKGERSNFAPISDLTESDRNRKLKDRYGGYYATYRNDGRKEKKKSKGKYKKYGKKARPKCRKVVEPVEFFMDPPVEAVPVFGTQILNITSQNGMNFTMVQNQTTTGVGQNQTTAGETIDFDEMDILVFDEFNETSDDTNTTDDFTTNNFFTTNTTLSGKSNNSKNNNISMPQLTVSFGAGDLQELGTKFIFNGPLFVLDDDEGIVILDDFFISGVCTRTWMSLTGVPGASHCSLALSVDTGDSILIEGEVFDGWNSNLSVQGGTLELMGSDGQITITPVNDMLVPLGIGNDVFLDSAFLRARGTLVYNICEERFWNQAERNFQNLDIEIGGSYPDPFNMMANR